MSEIGRILDWLRANPEAAIDVCRSVEPVGDWERRTVNKPSHEEQLIRRNHRGHVVAAVAASWGAPKFPDRAFCAWMTYPGRAPHGLYRPTVPEAMMAADAELQENPKCILVNPRTNRSPASERPSPTPPAESPSPSTSAPSPSLERSPSLPGV